MEDLLNPPESIEDEKVAAAKAQAQWMARYMASMQQMDFENQKEVLKRYGRPGLFTGKVTNDDDSNAVKIKPPPGKDFEVQIEPEPATIYDYITYPFRKKK